jgi:hypothetical protein
MMTSLSCGLVRWIRFVILVHTKYFFFYSHAFGYENLIMILAFIVKVRLSNTCTLVE